MRTDGWKTCALPLDQPPGPVERVENLDRRQFLEEYHGRRPVIVTGIVREWPAATRWTPEYLKGVCGDYRIEVRRHAPGLDRTFLEQTLWQWQKVRLGQFVDFITQGLNTPRADGTPFFDGEVWDWAVRTDSAVFRDCPQLLPDLDASRLMGADPDRFLPYLWLGPAGYVTGLHTDTMPVNFLAHLYGRKRITLFDAEQTPYLYPQTEQPIDYGMYSLVDSFQPDLVAHPLFAKARALQAELEPGDLLYIPSPWWHNVQSLGVAISVTCAGYPA